MKCSSKVCNRTPKDCHHAGEHKPTYYCASDEVQCGLDSNARCQETVKDTANSSK